MRERRNPVNAKLAKGKKSRGVEEAPGKERAPTVPVPGVPRADEERARTATPAKTVDAMIDPVFVLDFEGRCVSANRAYSQMFGLEPKDFVGKSITEMPGIEKQKPEEVEKFMPLIREAIERGSAGPVELVLVAMDGKEIPLSLAGGVIKDAQGNPTHIVAVLRDITEHKKTEERLRASENKYRTLLENLPQKIFLKDRNSVYISCNENYAKDRKIKPEELVGKTDYDFFPKELAEKYRADDKRVMESGETIDVEERYIQEGQEVIIHIVKTPVKDEQGNIIGLLGIFWDITERKKIEEKLRLFLQSVESAIDGIAMGSLEGEITYVNEAFVRMFGYSREELIGKEIAFIYPEDQVPKLEEALKATLEGGWTGELVAKRKDGKLFPIVVSSSRVLDDEGKAIAHMASHRDIIERKRAKEELQKRAVIIDSTTDAVITMDLKGNIIFCNKGAEMMYGYTAKEMIGTPIAILYPKQELSKLEKIIENLLKGKKIPNIEVTVKHKNKKLLPIIMSLAPIKDEKGKVIELVGIAQNITELKRVEEALRESEARSRLILETMPSGLFTVDLDKRITAWSKGAEEITGLKAEQVIGKTCLEALDCDECKKGCALFDDRVDKPIYGKECAIHVDGRDIIVSKNADILKDSEGNTIGGLENFVDITERKKAEEEKLKAAADKQRMEELEKFAKIAVGRELKMVELKDQIKALELRLEGITEKG